MKLVRQPEGSSLCGQACVATIAGVSLEESIRAFDGTRGGTRTKQVINALRKFGIACGDKLLRITKKQNKTSTCIVTLHFDGCKGKHWVVYHEGRYLDPDVGIVTKYPSYVRETSFLPVYLEEGQPACGLVAGG